MHTGKLDRIGDHEKRRSLMRRLTLSTGIAATLMVFLTVGLASAHTDAATSGGCVVPKVTGKTLRAARKAIRRHHCKVGAISKVYSSHVKRGRVISEKPGAGAHRKRGKKVRLTVSKGPQKPPPPQLPPAATVVGSMSLGASGAASLTYGAGSVWAVLGDGRTIGRIDPATLKVTATITNPLTTEWAPAIAYGNGAIWVSEPIPGAGSASPTGALVRIDPATNAVVATIPVGRSPEGMAFTPGAVWTANHRSDQPQTAAPPHTFSVSKVDVAANQETKRVVVETRADTGSPDTNFCCGPQGATAGAGSVWVADTTPGQGFVSRINPATGAVIAKITNPGVDACGSMAADDTSVWITQSCDGPQLWRIDPATNTVAATILLDGVGGDVQVGLGSVWVSTAVTNNAAEKSTLTRIGRGGPGLPSSKQGEENMQVKPLLIALSVLTLGAGVLVGAASATYPGTNNGRLAFAMNVNGNVDIYSALPNGNDLRRLTNDPGFDACAAYSPSGKKIAFCSSRSGAFEIWKMKQNGTKQTQVTHLNAFATFPDFSPDGSKIAFDAGGVNGEPNDEIYVVNADGSGAPVQLTSNAGNNDYPVFSPDRSKIAFISDRTGIEQVWVMGSDGSNPTQLTFDPNDHDQLPDWSPDGSKIAYEDEGFGNGDIMVMDANGSDQHDVSNNPAVEFGAAWSPDGSQISYVSFASGPRLVYLMNADGSNQHPVTGGTKTQFVPGWQPRGERIDH
jgi:Tol biopolymer transport system component